MNRRVLKNQRKKSECLQTNSKLHLDKINRDEKTTKYIHEMSELLRKI